MNTHRAKLIAIAGLWILMPGFLVAPGSGWAAARQNPGQAADLDAGSTGQSPVALKKNTGNHPERETKANPDADSKKTEPATDSGSRTGRTQTKPLTPFVPSEKIPADQAVDFPADI